MGKARLMDIYGDPASRYQEEASMPLTDFSKIIAPIRGDRRDQPTREEVISGRISKMAAEGDENIVGYVSNYGAKINKICELLQTDSKNFVEAERIYRDLCDVASGNNEALTAMGRFADLRSPMAADLAAAATSLKSGKFNDTKVRIDGADVTLGQLFGGEGYLANRSRQLADLGYSQRTTDTYFGEDADKSEVVGTFIRPGIEAYSKDGQSLNQFHLQLNEAADYVNDNYDDMRAVLGVQGARELTRGVLKKYGDAGGMTEVMRGIVDHAKRFVGRDADGNYIPMENGQAHVANMLRGLDALGTAVFRNPDTGAYAEMSPSEKRFVTMAGLAALKSFSSVDIQYNDFSKPELTSAVIAVADVYNRARACGYDLQSVAKQAGRPVTDEVASFIRAYMTGSPMPPDSIVTAEMDADRFLGSCVQAGPAVERSSKPTGSRGYYKEDPAHFNGVAYPSDGAGWLQKRVVGAIKAATRQRRLGSGMSVRSAVEDMITGADRADFQDAVTGALAKSFDSGTAGATLSAVLYDGIVNRIVSGEAADPYDIGKEIGSIALQGVDHPAIKRAIAEGDIDAKTAEKAVKAAKSWHLANVSGAGLFAKERGRIVATLSSEFGGLDKESADVVADSFVQKAHSLMMDGHEKQAGLLLDAAQNIGFDYAPRPRRDPKTGEPVVDKNGNPMYEELQFEDGTREPLLEIVPGDIRRMDLNARRNNRAVYLRQQQTLSRRTPME